MYRCLMAISTLLLVTFFISAILGCAMLDHYGKLSFQQGGNKVTAEELAQTWESYHVHYTGISVAKPSALLFDPKGDNKILELHPWWLRVKDHKTLLEIVERLESRKEFEPSVWRILAPKGDFYGYMYTSSDHVNIKVVNEHTLRVDRVTTPSPGRFEYLVGQ